MAVMEAVWPITALYFGSLAWWGYRRLGRLNSPQYQRRTGAEPAYAGIVAFQDRLNPRALQINASATGNVDGLIYAKAATVTMQGGSQLIYSQFVVQALTLGGGPQIGQPTNWVPIGGGSGVKVISWQDF